MYERSDMFKLLIKRSITPIIFSILLAGFALAQTITVTGSNNIRAIQKILNIDPTGVLDGTTRDALKKFQSENGLPTSGKPDSKTIQALEQTTPQSVKEGVTKEVYSNPGDTVRQAAETPGPVESSVPQGINNDLSLPNDFQSQGLTKGLSDLNKGFDNLFDNTLKIMKDNFPDFKEFTQSKDLSPSPSEPSEPISQDPPLFAREEVLAERLENLKQNFNEASRWPKDMMKLHEDTISACAKVNNCSPEAVENSKNLVEQAKKDLAELDKQYKAEKAEIEKEYPEVTPKPEVKPETPTPSKPESPAPTEKLESPAPIEPATPPTPTDPKNVQTPTGEEKAWYDVPPGKDLPVSSSLNPTNKVYKPEQSLETDEKPQPYTCISKDGVNWDLYKDEKGNPKAGMYSIVSTVSNKKPTRGVLLFPDEKGVPPDSDYKTVNLDGIKSFKSGQIKIAPRCLKDKETGKYKPLGTPLWAKWGVVGKVDWAK